MKNNKGLSLVELIIAFALLAIIGVAANGLLGSGSRLFKNNTKELDLQQEAQSAFNHLTNLIVDTQRGLHYDDTTNTNERVLTILNNDNMYYIKYNISDKCIYYSEHTLDDVAKVSDVELITGVDDFTANIDDAVDEGKVQIYIRLANSDRGIEGKQIYSLRNNIKTNPDLDALRNEVINDVGEDLGRIVTNVVISGPTYCAKGETHDFIAAVTGENYPITSVKWSLDSGATSAQTVFESEDVGKLKIADDETASELTIKATSVGMGEDNAPVVAEKKIKVVKLLNMGLSYEEKNAHVGNILYVTGVPTVQNMAAIENQTFRIDFRLPTAAEVEEDQKSATPVGLRTYTGVEVTKSSRINACNVFLNRQMEDDEYIKECFENDGYVEIALIMSCPDLDKENQYLGWIKVKPTDIVDMDINGNLTVNRGSTSSLNAKINADNIDNRDITTIWSITKDAGLNKEKEKVSIDPEKGILTVSKDIDFSKEFKIEVTATASTEDGTKAMKNTVTVVIPKVSISLPIETLSINKGESDRFAFMINGLEVEAGDVICEGKPSLKNTLLYCTKNECVISVGKRETKDIAAVNIMLKDDTSISKGINLYILSEVKLYNVEGRKNVYAEYLTPKQVGSGGKTVELDDDTKLVYSVENESTVLTIGSTKYDYIELIEAKNGIKEWWIPRSNVEGKDLYIPVPGLSPDLPDEITTTYMLYYNEKISLKYTYEDRKTYVEVINIDDTVEKFYLSDESWKVAN